MVEIKLKRFFCFIVEDKSTHERRLFLVTIVNDEGDVIVTDLTTQGQLCDTYSEDTTVLDFCREYNFTFIKGYNENDAFKIILKEI